MDALPEAPLRKFSNPDVTAKGDRRAQVALKALETLWFNTGTLCNITCENCYIESSPRNDRLVYLTRSEVRAFLDEASASGHPPAEIGFTGGEPFMNPDILGMIKDSLVAGYKVLVLTNAMRPLQRLAAPLAAVAARFPAQLTLRVSLDHYTQAGHEALRGENTWASALEGLRWIAAEGIAVAVASRTVSSESESSLRAGFGALFAKIGLAIDPGDRGRLVVIPQMNRSVDRAEKKETGLGLRKKSTDRVMCATSRMVVKRKGAARPAVVACTLLPYDPAFELGVTLAAAAGPVKLNHRHCARFCVLGGASCSAHA